MKKIILILSCGLLGLTAAAIPHQVRGSQEITTQKLVVALRLLNTSEYTYREENGRFATLDEMLSFLRHKGVLGNSRIDLENLTPYELAVTTSPDGTHYQITLQRPSDMDDKGTWCKTAAFSDDRGVIFLGQPIDCEGAPR